MSGRSLIITPRRRGCSVDSNDNGIATRYALGYAGDRLDGTFQLSGAGEHRRGRGSGRSRLYRCEAIVIRRRDFGEADRLVTLLTDDYGKIRAIAKGTRRTKSRLAGHLEPFARTNLLIARGRNLDIITQAQVRDSMHHLRSSERSILYASHWAEIADQLMVEAQENRFAYGALVRALTSLELERSPEITSRICEWEFLSAAGFQPELFRCTNCGEMIQPGANGFHIEAGGVVCPRCHGLDPLSRDISNDALRVLRTIARGDGEMLYNRELGAGVMAEVEDVLIAYLRNVIERELHAYAILKSLDGSGGA
jgi:DNA repair protein RecO (recombination protein O)